MRSTLIRAAVLAAIVPLGASCAGNFPKSPIPGAFTENQADAVARANSNAAPGTYAVPKFAQRTGHGYIMEYHDDFDAGASPPRPSRLVRVNYNGHVQQYDFR